MTVINFFIAHPVLLAMTYSVLTVLSADLRAYAAFRKEHPGASYDFVVVGLRLFDGLIGPVILTLGAAGYSAANS